MDRRVVLLDVLDVLYQVRAEVYGDVESSDSEKFDEAIHQVETVIGEEGDDYSFFKILDLLAKFVQWLPVVKMGIELLQSN